jgi:imidazole glycerol phosphate synthase subunit hisF (EC 4.1.3.-)
MFLKISTKPWTGCAVNKLETREFYVVEKNFALSGCESRSRGQRCQFCQPSRCGDPVEMAQVYNDAGADELVFLDITATHEDRDIIIDVVYRTADRVFIPLTVGGGIQSLDTIKSLLRAGADKVSINSAAVRDPSLIDKASDRFGNQCIVVAIDARKRQDADNPGWDLYVRGGRENTGKDAIAWAKEAEQRGAGEILVTSMDSDGTQAGYDLELTRSIAEIVEIPVIASGGAGNCHHIYEAVTEGKAEAALLASLLHYGNSV